MLISTFNYKPLTETEIKNTKEFFDYSCKKDWEENLLPEQFINYWRLKKLGLYLNNEVEEYLEEQYRTHKIAELKKLAEKAVRIKTIYDDWEILSLKIEYREENSYQFDVRRKLSTNLYEQLKKKY